MGSRAKKKDAKLNAVVKENSGFFWCTRMMMIAVMMMMAVMTCLPPCRANKWSIYANEKLRVDIFSSFSSKTFYFIFIIHCQHTAHTHIQFDSPVIIITTTTECYYLFFPQKRQDKNGPRECTRKYSKKRKNLQFIITTD